MDFGEFLQTVQCFSVKRKKSFYCKQTRIITKKFRQIFLNVDEKNSLHRSQFLHLTFVVFVRLVETIFNFLNNRDLCAAFKMNFYRHPYNFRYVREILECLFASPLR